MNRFAAKLRDWSRKNQLLVWTLSGVLAGVVLACILKQFDPSEEVQLLLAYPGEMYIRLLQLMIIPSVVCSLFVGAGGLDAKSNGKIVFLTFGYFVATSLLATVLGVILVVAIQPGDPTILASSGNSSSSSQSLGVVFQSNNTLLDNFLDLGRNILPNNMFTAFFEQTTTRFQERGGELVRVTSTSRGTNTLGVITYTLMFGFALASMGERGKPVMDLVKIFEALVMKTVTGIIWGTPVGVASIICSKILEVDNMWSVMAQLGLFVLTVSLGMLIHQWGILQLLYFLVIQKNPLPFYIGILPAALTGFSTCSSGATLPMTLKCLDENVKVDPRVSRFVVPTGVVMNMDGTAMFICVATIFIAQMNDMTLSFADYLIICITSTAVSIAIPSASPSASLTHMFIVMNAINADTFTKDIGLLFVVDWFLDRLRTTNNVLGDCYCSAFVEHWTKLDLKARDSADEGGPEKSAPLASSVVNTGEESKEKQQVEFQLEPI